MCPDKLSPGKGRGLRMAYSNLETATAMLVHPATIAKIFKRKFAFCVSFIANVLSK